MHVDLAHQFKYSFDITPKLSRQDSDTASADRVVRQREFCRLRRLQKKCGEIATDLGARIEAGAWVEPGPFSLEAGQIIARSSKRRIERFRMIGRLFDQADFAFVAHLPHIERQLRRGRMKVFRIFLRAVASDTWKTYKTRMSRIRASDSWNDAYLGLLWDTATAFNSIARLWLAARLFVWHIPEMIDVASHINQLARYASSESIYGTAPN